MSGTPPAAANAGPPVPLAPEAWTWYAVVMTIVIARFVSRFIQCRCIKKFVAEDWVMAVVAMLYTAEIVLLIKSTVTPTNLFPPNQPFDPNNTADTDLRIYGSKLIVALEQVYCAAIWGCKICLLLYYANITYSLPVSYTWTKVVAAYVVMGYTVMVALYFGVWCQPFDQYWSVPADNTQCSTAWNHLVLNCILNISSDIMIMLIPLPLLVKTNLPLRKKFVLCGVFSLGGFVIMCAALNKYSSFRDPWSNDWVFWYTREISTAVIVANIPHLWALLRKIFRLPTFLSHQNTPRSYSKVIPKVLGQDRSETPARSFESADDPLSPKRKPMTLRSRDSIDIDKVLSDAEREAVPMEPVRFRDLRNREAASQTKVQYARISDVGHWTQYSDGSEVARPYPTSPAPSYYIQPPTPLSPITLDSERRLLSASPSPPRSPRQNTLAHQTSQWSFHGGMF